MLSINYSELIWTVINFFLLLFLLKHFLFDPLGKFMDERQARINAGFEAERKANEEIARNAEALKEAKTEARLEAGRILTSAGEEDQSRSAARAAEAKAEAAQARKAAGEQLSAQREQEEAELLASEPELAAVLASQLLQESK